MLTQYGQIRLCRRLLLNMILELLLLSENIFPLAMQTAIVCVQHARTTLQFVACIMPSKALPLLVWVALYRALSAQLFDTMRAWF